MTIMENQTVRRSIVGPFEIRVIKRTRKQKQFSPTNSQWVDSVTWVLHSRYKESLATKVYEERINRAEIDELFETHLSDVRLSLV